MTIKKIAELAGVSTATVSYVINNSKNVSPEKRKRVLDAIAQSGYQPNQVAKSLRVKKTNNIGVLVEDIRRYPTPDIINGISEYAEQNGYNLLLNDLRMLESLFNQYDQITQQKEKINKAMSLLIFGAKVEAVIYVGMFDRDITGIINKINKPLIIAYSTSTDPTTCSVTYDNEDISAETIHYLLDMGHSHIAIITGLAHTNPAKLRLRGIQRAFREVGLVLDNAMVKNGDWEYASGYSCMAELLEQEPSPTAVFAMNDLMAIGAMDAISDAGLRVPHDISVIGFDNRDIASLVRPKLTTIEIDLKGIGLAAAKMTLRKIHGNVDIDDRNIILPSKFVLRDTVVRI